MEQKKLNFNAPLLSVRRYSSALASSDSKGKKIENPQMSRRRTLPLYKCDFNSDQVTDPVAVPFKWEQIPGRAKDGSVPEPRVHEKASATPTALPGRPLDIVKYRELEDPVGLKPNSDKKSFGHTATELDHMEEGSNEKVALDLEDDDVYSDALETLSPPDSVSMNCSLTNLSGYDGPVVKSLGTFCNDSHTRDFMMSRFLPAAKAMTLETPHYASRRQPVAVPQPRQITKAIRGDKTPPVNQNTPIIIPNVGKDGAVEESEDEYDEFDTSGNISAKACGLLPRLCLKNSMSILNPVQVLKVRTQAFMSANHDSTKPSKIRSQSQNTKKHSGDKQKLDRGAQSPRLYQTDNKLTCGSNRFNYTGDRQTLSRSTSPFRRSRGASPCRKDTPQSPFRRTGFQAIPKVAEQFKADWPNLNSRGKSRSQELSSHYSAKGWSCPMNPTIEKTVYVDTVNTSSKSGSLVIKGYPESAGKCLETLSKSREKKEPASTEDSFEDSRCPNLLKGEDRMAHKLLGPPTRDEKDPMEELREEPKAKVCNVTSNENQNIHSGLVSDVDNAAKANTSLVQSPVPLFLPKTPSESWLWRTLPSIPSQNPLSRIYRGKSFQSKWLDSKSASSSTKWETIVKSSYSHHDHVRYSQELLPHASQQSKS